MSQYKNIGFIKMICALSFITYNLYTIFILKPITYLLSIPYITTNTNTKYKIIKYRNRNRNIRRDSSKKKLIVHSLYKLKHITYNIYKEITLLHNI